MKEAAAVKRLVDMIIDRYQKIESTLPLLAKELSHTERKALKLVAASQKMTIGHIGEALKMPPSSTTWTVNNLVKRGVFRREPDTTDKRKTWIALAERGEALAGLMDRIPDRIASDLLYKLDKEQREIFVELVTAALERIEQIGAFK
ncbi:MAG: MarR family transcriptional regulator [Nitrospinota bacterium]|nr:MarR family transcriptional regulator [Nitrospinota bacterium]MDH5678941.1 MarR family transcriptional regulator [Nitrospinota bacterium]MDH5755757.1 MarR family transcriptional regulator [Nitrospinota bacterium]